MPLLKPPFQLKPRHTLICMLMLATPLTAMGASDTTTATKTINVKQKAAKKISSAKKTKDTSDNTQLAFEDMVVTEIDSEDGKAEMPSKTDFATPKVRISKQDLEKFNAITTADSVKYESGVFVRQRYIGDPNAPIGMRGSNPYQGGRVMVFADGMPIWNSLQYSFNGSPRWGLIGPDEIKSVEVLGGPFSAEYSGNAMGGVVNFTTLLPQKREVYTESTYMLQPYHYEGTSENLQGFKSFGSYGEKFDKLSSYFSYTHIENQGQPMTLYNTSNTASPYQANGGPLVNATPFNPVVTGGVFEQNPKAIGTTANVGGKAGQPRISYGDSGVSLSIDNLYKWKGGYAITPKLDALFTTAFEDLTVSSTGNSFLRDSKGNVVYGTSGSASSAAKYNFDGKQVQPLNSSFGTSNQDRQTFTVSGGLKGQIYQNWNIDTNVSWFDVIKDQTVSSTVNPDDPRNTNAGQVNNTDSMGWVNGKVKLDNEEFLGNKDLSFSTGFEIQNSKMYTSQYSSNNYLTENQTALNIRSGGITNTYALFGQLTWRFLQDWDATFGTRLERWIASNGVYQTNPNVGGQLPGSNANGFSPKFSLGFAPNRLRFRYSLGEAYRFPLVSELYNNSSTLTGNSSYSNYNLKPEHGLHQNILSEYNFDNGFARLNLFHEAVENTIYAQSISNSALGASNPTQYTSYMSNIGEVVVNGIDVTLQHNNIFASDFDVKADSTILHSEITKNPTNPIYVGKNMALLPNFRANFLTTYHVLRDLDTSVGLRYQSHMYSQLDNQDQDLNYYAGFNSSYFVDLKSTYHFNNKKGHVSAGIDNVNNYRAFYNHPLPMRSFSLQVGYKF